MQLLLNSNSHTCVRQDVVNRQNSIDDIPQSVNENFGSDIANHFCEGMKLYERMLEAGVAKECARAVLPTEH